jgi:hypothetical protein
MVKYLKQRKAKRIAEQTQKQSMTASAPLIRRQKPQAE